MSTPATGGRTRWTDAPGWPGIRRKSSVLSDLHPQEPQLIPSTTSAYLGFQIASMRITKVARPTRLGAAGGDVSRPSTDDPQGPGLGSGDLFLNQPARRLRSLGRLWRCQFAKPPPFVRQHVQGCRQALPFSEERLPPRHYTALPNSFGTARRWRTNRRVVMALGARLLRERLLRVHLVLRATGGALQDRPLSLDGYDFFQTW